MARWRGEIREPAVNLEHIADQSDRKSKVETQVDQSTKTTAEARVTTPHRAHSTPTVGGKKDVYARVYVENEK